MGLLRRMLPLLLAATLGTVLTRSVDLVEIFSGEKAVTNGLMMFSFKGMAIDHDMGPNYDILTTDGFFLCLLAVLSIKRGGLLWMAPPCSSWVWMSRGSTGRRPHDPMGDASIPNVQAQNKLACRVANLMYVASRRGVRTIIEQPLSSLFWKHPRVAKMLERFSFQSVTTQLGAYGAESLKPIILRYTVPWGAKLRKQMSTKDKARLKMSEKKTYKVRTDKAGKLVTDGVKKNLKATQAYPPGFGNTVGLLMRQHQDVMHTLDLGVSQFDDDFWMAEEDDDSSMDEEDDGL